MFTLGITNVPYISGYNEIRSLLSSPLCKIIKKGEKLQWGDVMAFRQILPFAPDESGKFTKHILDDRHTSIYLDARTTYSQNGIDHPVEVQATQEVIDLYMEKEYQKERCKNVDDFKEVRGECYTVINYYRCQSVENYLNGEKGIDISKDGINLIRSMMEIDRKDLVAKINLDQETISSLNKERHLLQPQIENHLWNVLEGQNPSRKQFFKFILEKINRIIEQR